MSAEGSVTHLIQRLKAGDQEAVQPLWERYVKQLVALARKKLHGVPQRAANEEDVVQNAFASFCRRAEAGCFPQLHDRNSLWALLVVLTVRKAYRLRRDEDRRKPRGYHVLDEGALDNLTDPAARGRFLEQVISREPTPEDAAWFSDEVRQLLETLPDDELRSIALLRMEEYTNEEIAAKLGCTARTVRRRLERVRRLLERQTAS